MFAFAVAEPRSAPLAALPSTLIHAVSITGALWLGRPAGDLTTGPVKDPIDITWVVPRPMPTAPVTMPGIPVVPTGIDHGISIPEIPVIGPSLPGTTPVDPRTLLPGAPPSAGIDTSRAHVGSATTIYQESEVDDPPTLLTAPALRYPRVLAEAGIDGRVILSFVIDAGGRVVAGSVTAEAATHPAFVPAAEEAVYASRFRPAYRRGEGVAVRVRQAVVFRH